MPLEIRIRPSTGTPLYRQIVDEVRSAFVRGFLEAGERLPSVRELASSLAVNPATVVKAYDALEAERLIVRRQGLGAFVAGGEPLVAPGEDEAKVRELAAGLALEGRRHGWKESRLMRVLEEELRKLRPLGRKVRPRKGGTSPKK